MDATTEIPPDDVRPARLEPSKPPMIRNDLKRLRHGEPVVDSQRTTSSFSPIRLLSMEILQLVFLFAASHQPHEYATYLKWSASPRRKQSWAGALSLTWVCSWWQKVALSYPTIWRSIHIDVSQFSPKGSDNQLFFVVFVGECLRRSGPCLALDIGLNLNVDIGNFRFHKSNEGLGLCDLRGVFDTLAFFAGRWRRIEISSEFSNSFHNLNRNTSDQHGCLQSHYSNDHSSSRVRASLSSLSI
ncbi:hypothetical protein F5878DRAFT_434742 [Lentinula raphanica]|uniref:F-box domain-containing protein n=1 Tax=Lentinula raphanica TaxID=153919 RepID=A0AA38NYB8_9AGAR|nr:hypothetical protein F5878DRAFT_434742 [Lentinula raphanica]